MAPERARASLALLSAAHGVTHVQAVVFGLIYPFAMHALGFGYAAVGVMAGAVNAAFGLSQGVHAWLARRVRRKALLGGGNVLIGAALALSGLAGSFPFFFGSRLLSGVAASPQHPMASSLLSDLYPRERRGWAFAVHFAGGNVGTLLAPLLAGFLLAHTDWRRTLLWLALPAAVIGALLWVGAEDRRRPTPAEAGRPRPAARLASLRRREVALVLASSLFTSGGQGLGIILTYVPLYLVATLHRSAASTGAYVTVLTAGSVVAPVMAGRIADRLGRRPVILVSLWLSALATALLVRAGAAAAGLVAAMALLGLAAYNASPLTQAMLADLVPDEERDGVFSVYYVVTYVCGAAWAFAIGLLAARQGFAAAFSLMVAAFALSGLVFLFVRERRAA